MPIEIYIVKVFVEEDRSVFIETDGQGSEGEIYREDRARFQFRKDRRESEIFRCQNFISKGLEGCSLIRKTTFRCQATKLVTWNTFPLDRIFKENLSFDKQTHNH